MTWDFWDNEEDRKYDDLDISVVCILCGDSKVVLHSVGGAPFPCPLCKGKTRKEIEELRKAKKELK